MDTKIIVVGIVLALIVGTGAGYTLSLDSTSSPELESQIEEHQSSIRTLENDNSDLQASLTSAMNTNTELQTTLISTESENNDLHNILNDIQTYVDSVETQITTVQGGLGSPDYDSGWITIDPGETKSMEHGLGTDEDLFVYVIGRYREGQTNQLYYGLGYLGDVEIGNGWTMDDTFISITRGVADVHWDETRVYIWKMSQELAGTQEPVSTHSDLDLILEENVASIPSESLHRISLNDLSKYKILYVFYAEVPSPDLICKIYYELDEGNFHFLADTLDGNILGESPAIIEVAAPNMEIWIENSHFMDDLGPIYVAVYGSTK
jgi:hypothetical protein